MPVPSLRHALYLAGATLAACAATYNLTELLSPRPAAVQCLEDEVLRYGECISIVEDHRRQREQETIELEPKCFSNEERDESCYYVFVDEGGQTFWLNLIHEEAASAHRVTIEELELPVVHLSSEASQGDSEGGPQPDPGTCIRLDGGSDIYCRFHAAD